jgi:hypothetical protein
MNVLIPKGYFRIAVSQLGTREVTAYYSTEDKKLLFESVDEFENVHVFGPLNVSMLEACIHCFSDVHSMRGQYANIPG